MNISDRAQQLIWIKFDQKVRNHLLHLQILLHHAVRSIRDVVHYNVEVDLFGFVTVSVEWLAHFNAVRVVKHLQYLQLSILVSLVLEHLLDGHGLSRFRDGGLENHAKRSISNDFLSVICETLLYTQREKELEVSNGGGIIWRMGRRAFYYLQRVACFCVYPGLLSPSYPPIYANNFKCESNRLWISSEQNCWVWLLVYWLIRRHTHSDFSICALAELKRVLTIYLNWSK